MQWAADSVNWQHDQPLQPYWIEASCCLQDHYRRGEQYQKEAETTNQITVFIAQDLRPITTVKWCRFEAADEFFVGQAGYQVPSCTHITATGHRMYTAITEELLVTLISPHTAFTTSLWTSKATEAYLTVIYHFITAEWNLVSRVLLTHEMPDTHTGEHAAARLCHVEKRVETTWQMCECHCLQQCCEHEMAVEEVGRFVALGTRCSLQLTSDWLLIH